MCPSELLPEQFMQHATDQLKTERGMLQHPQHQVPMGIQEDSRLRHGQYGMVPAMDSLWGFKKGEGLSGGRVPVRGAPKV